MIKQLTSVFAGILLFIAAITFFSSVYIVDETKQVFVTQFGKIVRGPINGPDTVTIMHISGNTTKSAPRPAASAVKRRTVSRFAALSPGSCWNCTEAARRSFIGAPCLPPALIPRNDRFKFS